MDENTKIRGLYRPAFSCGMNVFVAQALANQNLSPEEEVARALAGNKVVFFVEIKVIALFGDGTTSPTAYHGVNYLGRGGGR